MPAQGAGAQGTRRLDPWAGAISGMGGSMALFLSTTVNKVDKKGRVSVPSTFRAALSEQGFNGVFLFRAIHHPAIEGWGAQKMEQLARGIEEQYTPFSDSRDDFSYSILADAVQLPCDS